MMHGLNVWAIVAAALSSFLLGGPWYSNAVFGRAWNADAGTANKQERHGAAVFGGAFVFSLVSATVFAWWLGPAPALQHALVAGVAAGAGLVASSFGINYLFAGRSLRMLLIDGGYHIVQFLLYAVILSAWPA